MRGLVFERLFEDLKKRMVRAIVKDEGRSMRKQGRRLYRHRVLDSQLVGLPPAMLMSQIRASNVQTRANIADSLPALMVNPTGAARSKSTDSSSVL